MLSGLRFAPSNARRRHVIGNLAHHARGNTYVFAQRDGKRCGDGALDVLKCLADTKAGKPFQRLSIMVARWYRESVLKEDARLRILARE
ncbi:hypothetical protein R70211_01364 [Paraburkholderia domus]|uniref:Uncharacterized protein n=1 Tax=Paraburkholderia domus TaxID=2793075 RepID=A0A9N8QUM0_9BURK|nr:hypothetical protein R70211_01364 [Paraburkholderia domus]